ncbi:hypothetical protein CBL_11081 [Carabus blaptoides fortunei]
MKYIVFILVVSALVAQMAQAQGLFNAQLNGSVSGSIEVAGHRMNFTGEIRPRRDAPPMNETAVPDGQEHGDQADNNHEGNQD